MVLGRAVYYALSLRAAIEDGRKSANIRRKYSRADSQLAISVSEHAKMTHNSFACSLIRQARKRARVPKLHGSFDTFAPSNLALGCTIPSSVVVADDDDEMENEEVCYACYVEYLSGRRSSSGISLTWRILSAAAAGRALSLYASVVGCRPFLRKSNPPSDSPPSPFATCNYSFRSFESVCLSLCLSFSLSLSSSFCSLFSSEKRNDDRAISTRVRMARELFRSLVAHAHAYGETEQIWKWKVNFYAIHIRVHVCMYVCMWIVAVSIRNSNWKFKSREPPPKDVNCKRSVRVPFGLLTRN